MSLYKFRQYLRYRLKAKNRHGIHSPFVYQLLDECLLVNTDAPVMERLQRYFGEERLLTLDNEPANWQQELDEKSQLLDSDVILIVPAIHHSPQHTELWGSLSSDARVLLSIDLFNMGLLINRSDFKEKQHFVLRTA